MSYTYLDNASLPVMPSDVMKKEIRLIKKIQNNPGIAKKEFSIYLDRFNKETRKAFGEEYVVHPTRGTLVSFQRFVNFFWMQYKNAELVATPFEYLPMWYSIWPSRRHMVQCRTLDFNEEKLYRRMISYGKVLDVEAVVFLISSEMRIGGKRLDLSLFWRMIGNENKENKKFHLWVDASQDSQILGVGDVIWYSKRFAGTGGGLILIKNSYESLKDVLSIKSGYDVRYIVRVVSFLEKRKTVKVRFKEEISIAMDYISRNKNISDVCRLVVQEPIFGWGCTVDLVVRIHFKSLDIDVLGIERYLNKEQIFIGNFSLKRHTVFFMWICEIIQRLDNREVPVNKVVEGLWMHQEILQERLVQSLLPQTSDVDRIDSKKLAKYLRSVIINHEFFRVMLRYDTPRNSLLIAFKHLNDYLKKHPEEGKFDVQRYER